VPSEALLSLQRTAGNRAVQRLVMSGAEFREKTHLALAVRGRTLEEIDRLLEELGRLQARGAHLQPGHGMNRTLDLLTKLVQDADFWLKSHEDDTSRSKNRRAGILELRAQAFGELTELVSIREAAKNQAGLDVGQFKPTENAFLAKMEGSCSSILEKLGTAIGLAIPKPGDSVTAELSVKVPCDSYGVSYVGFRIRAEAARMDGRATNVRFEVAVTGGAQIASIVDVGAELGFFLQAQGATPEQAMKLISYGWYRKLRESPLPREIANFMWGGSATSVGWVRAEQWAANVEKEAFSRKDGDVPLSSGVGSSATTNQYVRMGVLGGVGAEAGIGGVVDVEGAASVNVGTHYDQRSVTAGKKGAVGVPQRLPGRGKAQFLGTSFLAIDTSIAASIGPFGGELAISLELMARKQQEKDRKLWIPEGYVSVSGSVSATLLLPPSLLPTLATWIKQLASPMSKGVTSAEAKAREDKRTREAGGAALGGAGDMVSGALSGISPDLFGTEQLAAFAAGAVTTPVTLTLAIAAGYEFGAGASGWTFDLSLSQETGLELEAGVVGLELKKGTRLFRAVLAKDGKWKVVAD
jgi:hypothetical protein